MAEVSLTHIEKRYGVHTIIPSLDLTIPDGEFTVLVGPSGCGKSTTLQIIAGLESISAGRLMIGGVDVTHLPPKDRNISMVFQSYALFPHMNVRDNISFGLKTRRVPTAEADQLVAVVSKRLKLESYLDRFPRELSGGQRQRVALGRALVRRPGVFLMDEPLSNLDAKLRVEARSFLSKMHQELGITTVYVTHDQSEAMTMGSRIVVMNGGTIQQAAAPMEVYRRPANRFVAGFIGSPSMNFVDLDVAPPAELVDAKNGIRISVPQHRQVELAKSGLRSVTLGLRPEHIRLLAAGDTRPGAASFKIEVCQFLGSETLLDITHGACRVIARVGPEETVKQGEERIFAFDMDHAHFFDPDSGNNVALDR
ncbi:glycerol-3-phosphate ABC transporter ATP-binding protein [Phyllobacterium brassicacearum]|uniref:Glycerol-3-phosphate ABC transporter ATP-binding protein n=1 Tax=Phyllobacterium brassicacearum TaxID=314235 RepID=A0A2P7BGQ9_9HYPH|nr:ABC transporter ATP-binding protein [Phyllobacterium brassicacearum]PSH65686.1 glycerol-3-phosphate ABC transporter ATP-binding protein [Phyllobacterium brassicacearum]TDQ16886.1 carbohydrate ABC transporter ATP-binding protein (CUT1 family) [Phyllobacterium brassicacearum]